MRESKKMTNGWPLNLLFPLRVIFLLYFLQHSATGNGDKTVIKPDYTACVDSLEQLAYKDLKTVQLLLKEVENLPTYSKLREEIKQYVENCEKSLSPTARRSPKLWTEKWVERQAAETANNPIAVFRLLFRMVGDWPDISHKIRRSNPKLQSSLTELESEPRLLEISKKPPPNETDIFDTVTTLLYFQTTYRISVADLARGIFPGKIDTGIHLDARHCFTLGGHAMMRGQLPMAVQWLGQALLRVITEKSEKSKLKDWSESQEKELSDLEDAIRKAIKTTAKSHDENFLQQSPKKKMDLFFQFVQLRGDIDRRFFKHLFEIVKEYDGEIQRKTKRRRSRFQQRRKQLAMSKETHLTQINMAFLDICQGHSYQTEAEKAPLFCWLERKKSLFHAIGPMKMEFLSRDPDIVQVYNVIGSRAMKKLENDSRGKFIHGPTSKAGVSLLLDFQVAMKMHVPVNMDIDLSTIYAHGEQLFQVTRGPFHFTKYASTGKFDPEAHSVCLGPSCGQSENRLANFLVYLSDVKLGGETVFPLLGFRTKVVPGSALLWFNVRGNGARDFRTTHATCPVLLGRKFKHTELVMYNPKFQSHKCPLDPNREYRISVNGKIPR